MSILNFHKIYMSIFFFFLKSCATCPHCFKHVEKGAMFGRIKG